MWGRADISTGSGDCARKGRPGVLTAVDDGSSVVWYKTINIDNREDGGGAWGNLKRCDRTGLMPEDFYDQIAGILRLARKTAYVAVNFTMVQAYWEIGRAIVAQQDGEERAQYGASLIAILSKRLTVEFGKGFDESNLLNMRRFYLAFPIQDSLRPELSWTHYRKLIKVKDETARTWYMNEAADEQWSTRQLDRQISTLYYERLLSSRDKAPVVREAREKLAAVEPEGFIKDPYVLEFLDLKDYPALRESELEQALIDNL